MGDTPAAVIGDNPAARIPPLLHRIQVRRKGRSEIGLRDADHIPRARKSELIGHRSVNRVNVIRGLLGLSSGSPKWRHQERQDAHQDQNSTARTDARLRLPTGSVSLLHATAIAVRRLSALSASSRPVRRNPAQNASRLEQNSKG